MCKRRIEIYRKIDETVNMCVNSYKVQMSCVCVVFLLFPALKTPF